VVQRIHSTSNPQLRRLKRLHKVDRDQSEFLVEGTHLLTEALVARWPLRGVFYTEQWVLTNGHIVSQIDDGVEQYLVDPQWLKQAVTTQQPDGVVGIGCCHATGIGGGRQGFSEHREDWSLVLAADGIQDPGNAGTLLRSVVGLGADRMYLSPDSVSPWHPKFLRSTAGQWFRSPPGVARVEQLADHAKRMGARVVVADMQGESICGLDLSSPTMFVVGSEGCGIRSATLKLADAVCSVPMVAGVESLNVAIAGTLLLYEAARQRGKLRD